MFTREFKINITLYNSHTAVQAVRQHAGIGFLIQSPDEEVPHPAVGDAVLTATGRVPNTEDLELKATGVAVDDHGWIIVNDHLAASADGVFACGDVIGKRMFKHASSREGEVAIANSQLPRDEWQLVNDAGDPHAVFSCPQVGSVGLTEQACIEQGLSYRVVKRACDSIMKGELVGAPPGLAKLLVEEGTDRILGFHMVGPNSAGLVFAVTAAMQAPGVNARLVKEAVAIHPTLTEFVRGCFEDALA